MVRQELHWGLTSPYVFGVAISPPKPLEQHQSYHKVGVELVCLSRIISSQGGRLL